MLYMVEMDMPHAERLAEWHDWYDGHVRRLMGMPGFLRAQRFQSVTASPAPYLAVYSVAGAIALANPTYAARAGPQSAAAWAPFMRNWRRNLLAGMDAAPEVPPNGWLAVLDRITDDAPTMRVDYTALTPAGLDGTIVQRGLLFGNDGSTAPEPAEGPGWSLRILTPIRPLVLSRGVSMDG